MSQLLQRHDKFEPAGRRSRAEDAQCACGLNAPPFGFTAALFFIDQQQRVG
ncbi:MAG TPA: hypothetical protein VMR62_29475 [Bryobacteraceae bacterium]|nr:hypothetical protein [Bryobacteraceae bacterium]